MLEQRRYLKETQALAPLAELLGEKKNAAGVRFTLFGDEGKEQGVVLLAWAGGQTFPMTALSWQVDCADALRRGAVLSALAGEKNFPQDAFAAALAASAWQAFPLFIDDQTVACLEVFWPQASLVSEDDALLQSIIRQAASQLRFLHVQALMAERPDWRVEVNLAYMMERMRALVLSRPGDWAKRVLEILAYQPRWHCVILYFYEPDCQCLKAVSWRISDDVSLSLRACQKAHRALIAWVQERRQPLMLNELRQDVRYAGADALMQAGLYLPVLEDGQLAGVLSLESQEPRAFTAADFYFLEKFTDFLAVLRSHQRQLRFEKEKANVTQILSDLAQALIRAGLSREKITQTARQTLTELFSFDLLLVIVQSAPNAREKIMGLSQDAPLVLPPEISLLNVLLPEKRPRLFRDFSRSPRARRAAEILPQLAAMRSLLLAPLRNKEHQVAGALVLASSARGAYDAQDLNLLNAIVTQVNLALQNVHLFAETNYHSRQLQAMATALRVLAEPDLDVNVAARRILDAVVEALPAAEKGALSLLDEDGHLRIKVLSGYQDQTLLGQALDEQAGYAGWAFRSAKPILANHVREKFSLPLPENVSEAAAIQSGIAVPLRRGAEVIGVLTLDNASSPEAFSPDDLQMLVHVGHTAEIILQRAEALSMNQRRLRQLEILTRVSNKLTRSTMQHEKDLWQAFLQELMEIFEPRALAITVYDAERGGFIVQYGAGDWQAWQDLFIPMEDTLHAHIVRTRKPVFAERVADLPVLQYRHLFQPQDALAAVPILHDEQVSAVIWVIRSRRLSEHSRSILRALSGMFASVLARVRLMEQMRENAQKISALNRLAQDLALALDMDGLRKRLMRGLPQIFPSLQAALYWDTSANSPKLRLQAAYSEDTFWDDLPSAVGDCPLHESCALAQGLLNTNWQVLEHFVPLTSHPRLAERLQHTLDESRYLVCLTVNRARMNAAEKGYGVLQLVFKRSDFLDEPNQELLTNLSNLLSAEISNQEFVHKNALQALRWARVAELAHFLMHSGSAEQVYERMRVFFREALTCEDWVFARLQTRQRAFRPVFAVQGGQVVDEISLPAVLDKGAAYFEKASRVYILHEDGVEKVLAQVLSADGPCGILVLRCPAENKLAADDLYLIEMAADLLGVTLYNLTLYQKQQQRLAEAQALHRIDGAITASTDLSLAVNVLGQQAQTLLGVDIVSVLLYDETFKLLNFGHGLGFRTSSYRRIALLEQDALPYQAINARKPVFWPKIYHDLSPVESERLAHEGVQAAAILPLFGKKGVLGVLEFYMRHKVEMNSDWRDFAIMLAGEASIAVDNYLLFEGLRNTNNELMAAYEATIEGWALALEMRDRETEGHARRVTEMTVSLARYMGLPEDEIVHVRRGALLHDIGKLGVPDHILHKKGPLNDDEWAIMKQHPVFAYNFLYQIAYLRPALDIPYCHHERWDGSGYPRGLRGEEIPLVARIFAVIDVYDALTNDRPYRAAWSHKRTIDYICSQKGSHFDPRVADAFCAMMRERNKRRAFG